MFGTSTNPAVRIARLAPSVVAATMLLASPAHPDQLSSDRTLKSPTDFTSIANPAERSRMIFNEIGKVLTHPRCMNCHPAGDHPLQGADRREHSPPAWRAEATGFPGNCHECHTDANFTLPQAASYKSIPGHPRWDLAPLSMACQGKSLNDICRQLKD